MGKRLFDLEKHFAFYGAYHSNAVNVLIHTLFVWPIFFTSLILFHFTPPFFRLPLVISEGNALALNLGFVVALVFAASYVCMDRKAGSLAAGLCMACWVSSDCLASRLGFSLLFDSGAILPLHLIPSIQTLQQNYWSDRFSEINVHAQVKMKMNFKFSQQFPGCDIINKEYSSLQIFYNHHVLQAIKHKKYLKDASTELMINKHRKLPPT